MVITKVKYYDFSETEGSFLSRCSIVFDDSFILHDIKIFNGLKGEYIVFPSRKDVSCNDRLSEKKGGEELFHPVEKLFFDYISKVVLEGYMLYKETGVCTYKPTS